MVDFKNMIKRGNMLKRTYDCGMYLPTAVHSCRHILHAQAHMKY